MERKFVVELTEREIRLLTVAAYQRGRALDQVADGMIGHPTQRTYRKLAGAARALRDRLVVVLEGTAARAA